MDKIFEGLPQPVPRKAGRPRKEPLPEATPAAPSVYTYTARTSTGIEIVVANDFIISDKGDLLLFAGDNVIAAFRDWRSITGEKRVDLPVGSRGTVTVALAPDEAQIFRNTENGTFPISDAVSHSEFARNAADFDLNPVE